MKKVIMLVLGVVLVAGISGGGVYLWQKDVWGKEKALLTKNTSVVMEKQEEAKSDKIDYSSWLTYKSDDGLVEFKYPDTFAVVYLYGSKSEIILRDKAGILYLVKKDIREEFIKCYEKNDPECLMKNINGLPYIAFYPVLKKDSSLLKTVFEESGDRDIFQENKFGLVADNNVDYLSTDNSLDYIDFYYTGLGNNRTIGVDLKNGTVIIFSDSFMSEDDTILNIAKSVSVKSY